MMFILGLGVVLITVYFIFSNGNDGQDVGSNLTVPSNSGGEIVTEPVFVADGKYQDFSQEAFEAVAGEKRRVYFFHAPWCPTCRAAHEIFLKEADRLPDDVAVFKIDYDSNRELRRKFEIPYQHVFVEVDENGELVQIWNGGAVDGVVEKLK